MSASEQQRFVQKHQCPFDHEQRKLRIRDLNDDLRKHQIGGVFICTRGVQQLGSPSLLNIFQQLRDYAHFSADNDPHREHDFGVLNVDGERILWKIDYYDRELGFGSPDPADPSVTSRVLTIMLASEY